MDNNNLRNPGVPYAVNGGTPSPAPGQAPTPLFANVARSTPPAPLNTPVSPPVSQAAAPIQVQAPIPANPLPAATPPAPPPPAGAAPIPPPKPPKKPRDWRKIGLRTGISALILLLAGGAILVYDRLRNTPTEQTGSVNSTALANTNIPLSEFANSGSLALLGTQSLTVNGQLRANESFVLAPQNQPGTGERGQIYYDNNSNQLAYFNGTQFVKLPGSNFVQTFQGQGGNVTLVAGNGISVNGTTLTNSGVTSLGGQTGDITVGSGLSVVGTSLQATGVQSLSTTSATLTITNDGAGNLTIDSTGAGTGTVTSGGGTSGRIALFTGAQNIEDSAISQSGTTVTVNGDLTITGAIGLSSPLSVANGGTGANSLTANGVIVGNGTSAVSSVAAGGAGLCLMSTASTPSWQACPGGGGVTSLDGLTGGLTLANSSGSGGTITINDASTSAKGIAQFNSTNFSVTGGAVNTIQDIAVSAAPTFGRLTVTSSQATNAMLLVNNTNAGASGNLLDVQLNGSSKLAVSPAGAMTLTGTLNGQTISSSASFTGSLAVAGAASLNGGASVTGTLTANTITPTSALTIGTATQSFTVQGNASSTLTATNGASTTTVSFQTPTANVNYRLLTAAAGTYDICTSIGNCASAGGGVTTPGGSVNKVAKFTGSQTLGDSIITDNGSTVTIGGTLAVNTITPAAAMTIGSTSQTMTLQGSTTQITATSGGITNTLTFATPATANKTITIPNANGTVAVSATGPLAVDANGNISCPTCVTSGGGGGGVGAVDSLDGLTGALTIANSSGSGSIITINDASTSQKGIAQFNSTNFSASGGVVNTVQDIAVSAAPTFGRLSVTSSQASNPMFLVNNTNAGASGNLLDLQLNGSSKLAVSPAGAMTLVGALNGQTISSAANFTGTLAVTGAANLNGGATVSGTLTANTITPSGSLTVGATSQSFLVQGSAASTITATSGANTTTLAFQTPTAAVTYRFLTAAAGTYDVCTTVGNCAGVGGGVTTAGGSINKLAKFTTSSAIGDSIITDNGSTVTIGGTLAVNTLTPTAALTVGATGQNLTLQGATTNLTSTSGGITNTLTFATPATSNKTITVPNASGTLVVSASGPLAIDPSGNITCATCTTTSTAVTSLDGLTGTLTLANSSGSAGTITIDNASTSAKGIAQFNSTNFSVASGVVNTVQDINSTAAPTFGQLTITSSQAVAKMLTINNTNGTPAGNLLDLQVGGASKFNVSPAGALTLNSTVNGQTISSTASFTGSLAVTGAASLNGGASVTGTLTANTITPSSALTVGATGQSFTLQGNAASTITATNSGNTTTLAFQTPTAAVTYRFLTATAGTYDVCTTAAVCTGYAASSGSANYINNSTTVQTNANFNIRSVGTGSVTGVFQGANGQTVDILQAQTWDGVTATTVFAVNKVGALALSGTGTTTFTTPSASTSIDTKISVAPFDPGSNGQLLALGLTSTANATARGISLYDARTVGHSPTLAIMSPNEANTLGFNWNGVNTTALIGTNANSSGATAGVTLQSGGVTAGNGNSGAVNILTGAVAGGSGGFATGDINLVTGNASGTTANSGSIGLDVGTATGSVGTINIANTNALAVNIGHTSGAANTTTTIKGLTVIKPNTDSLTNFKVTDSAGNQLFATGGASGVVQTELGGANVFTGKLKFDASGSSNGITLVGQNTPGGNRTITLPDADGTLCLDTGNCSGTNGYILNQSASNQTGDFRISGTGRANTSLLTPLLDTPTSAALNVGTTNATTINLNQNTTLAAAKTLTVTSALTTLNGATSGDALSVSNSTSTGNIAVFKDNATAVLTIGDGGATTLQNETNQLSALKIATTAASGAHTVFNADTINERVGIGGIATASKFEVQGGDGAIYWSGNNPRLILGDSTTAGQNGYLQWDSTNDYFRIETVGTNGLKIKDNYMALGNIFPDQPLKIGNGSTLLHQINTTGDSYFKTSTDSTTAFRVLNNADVSQFTVDSSNSRVYIGNPTADATGALLILDTKNSLGDPTGVAGGMYYNSALQQFRCFRSINGTDGDWEACGTNPIDRGWEVDDEFLGGINYSQAALEAGLDINPTGMLGDLGWVNNNSGGTTFTYNVGMLPTADHPGTMEIQTPGGSASNGSTLTLNGDGANSVVIAAGNAVKMSVGFDSTLANLSFRGGLHSQLSTSTRPVSGVWWEAAPSVNANWQYCYGNGTTATCASSGVAVAATTWYRLEIRVVSTGSGTSAADFFLNGTKFSVSGVTIDSTNTVNPALACWATANIDRYCSIDYFQFRGVASTSNGR